MEGRVRRCGERVDETRDCGEARRCEEDGLKVGANMGSCQ